MNADAFTSADPVAWCPGCGNFGILNAMKKALTGLGRLPKDIVLVSGIGQAAKLPHYVHCNCFNGLHGRALPAATGIKIANTNLTVIVTTGDGDCYGEGGNHLIHAIRRNIDITVVVHDNQIYGLTKGQASPTTEKGQITKTQRNGVITEPLHPMEMAIALGCGFVARGFSKELDHLSWLISEGVRHRGFSLIDALQPCVTFNKHNTYEWYSERVYKLGEQVPYDPSIKAAAYEKASEWENKIPIGIIYRKEAPSYDQMTGLDKMPPLVEHDVERTRIDEILDDFK
ncbi:MAG: 2-oxoacid ferredoxin oxidoreductase [Candidatus Raymondbacteria bacterium RifOxyA12_full_50_37]|uniref:2-oxoacid ferredoxin oxidoreductase n=1 Tax=Candidatus Raymondbacteria bacterium RIFOXYD12_FULL_49_13 TaxID=1817890 RepID=A0A1F7FL29_UNCRA|nr:MAG: 2-oxoacid ferredoxin oxidoreductase [Candidatus Raymondbacteria bacterium RifOxyA12_full_50_37]OGJ86118.1 MAG: 2-oxoacid ferredoxin oxidoreductase [Candidatus Raymondbacteria bacterium RIFOXYA2_FULL_49_16]OGJ86475.1 MAG: 2-oxoacid ferredoxin oxidoreductase [Candidatus Raymondbacteria bacterium RifOxyB12_full_50_8]OGJ95994.1 MAG: 2-oxoacid ferredoxin oxidoreductase [Candidatus Raymondbacteria bacterium RIFOXYC2_FULL_50_21]OGK05618.1 MAG: 2-oxoacid ferredoxin oxidoreductase [Candidatus Ra